MSPPRCSTTNEAGGRAVGLGQQVGQQRVGGLLHVGFRGADVVALDVASAEFDRRRHGEGLLRESHTWTIRRLHCQGVSVKSSRLLATVLLLQTKGRRTAAQLAEELDVSVRTVYRDVEALHAAGRPRLRRRGPPGRISAGRGLPHPPDRAQPGRGRGAVPVRAARPGGRTRHGQRAGRSPAQTARGAAPRAARAGRPDAGALPPRRPRLVRQGHLGAASSRRSPTRCGAGGC